MEDPQNSFENALAALNSGDLAKAEALFRGALNANPQHIGALNLLTIVLMQMGRRYATLEKARGLRSASQSFRNLEAPIRRLDGLGFKAPPVVCGRGSVQRVRLVSSARLGV